MCVTHMIKVDVCSNVMCEMILESKGIMVMSYFRTSPMLRLV